jgi:hypothetical protein
MTKTRVRGKKGIGWRQSSRVNRPLNHPRRVRLEFKPLPPHGETRVSQKLGQREEETRELHSKPHFLFTIFSPLSRLKISKGEDAAPFVLQNSISQQFSLSLSRYFFLALR